MANARVQRRLAAILAADIVAYSRLIEADESGTLAGIRAARAEVLDPLFADYSGRVVKLMGDGLIVEFGSVVDAVACAVAMQKALAANQEKVPVNRRIVFRIGIALGDVVVEGDDLFGDGINIAARLEALAEPGGICVTDAAHAQLAGKTNLSFQDDGECTLKNIAQPVRVWRWTGQQKAPLEPINLPLPDRPSIAVLPFDNLSGQSEETYFSDGITEDIITGLARFRSLFVIARNSSFAFRGKPVGMAEIGRKLGVSFLLQGSIRRAGERMRITAQLIEAATGAHVWAESYDRNVKDIFEVQDEVTQMIVATLFGRIEEIKLQRGLRAPTVSLAAYDLVLRGISHLRGYEPGDNEKALRFFEQAAALDPSYGLAHGYCGMAALFLHREKDEGPAPAELLRSALDKTLTGVRLDPQESRCHRALVIAYLFRGEHDLAEHHSRQATTLNANYADAMSQRGFVLTLRGRPEEALVWIEKAKRLNPFHPPYYDAAHGQTLHLMRRYGEAVQMLRRLPRLSPPNRVFLAACHAELGEMKIAQNHSEELLKEQPSFRASEYVERGFSYERQEDREHLREGLIKAGLPP